MKNKVGVALALLGLTAGSLSAQQVKEDNFTRTKVHYEVGALRYGDVTYEGSKYAVLGLDGYSDGGQVGSPTVPVLTSLLTIPFCSGVEVTVENAVYDTLPALDAKMMFPRQESRFKSDMKAHALIVDEEVYGTDAFEGEELAAVREVGIGRERNLAFLDFSPVKVNPVSGAVMVCRSADVVVSYREPDVEATMNHFARYYTPAFTVGQSINQLIPVKQVASSAPIRMVVLAPSVLRCKKLDEFVAWKRNQGLLTDVYYIDDMGLLTSAITAAFVADMFSNATAEEPAPTFLTLIGDDNLIPTFESQITTLSRLDLDEHITDLYYATLVGNDNIPDLYLGRMSARDTATLGNIIDKTLYYEQYLFEDDSYLNRGVLVAGVDYGSQGDNAYRCSDPSMDYIAKYYINAANGYDQVYYYKNLTTFAPAGVTVTGSSASIATADTLRRIYSRGAGWINYSAHGDWNMWAQPLFNTNHVGAMSNNNKPSIMIGNCCLSNMFDKYECFSEALVRHGNNAGAVAYIGATNSTLWDEDFYWSVGLRRSVSGTMDATFDSLNRGMYDNLFHTHGESYAATIATAGQMVVAGNMAVNSSSSAYYGMDMTQYYWEIYELMGDPSLMPWLGVASVPQVSIEAYDKIYVMAPPHAYVAIVDHSDMSLKAAAFADAGGYAELPMIDAAQRAQCHVAVTAQGYRPYRFDLAYLDAEGVGMPEVALYPNPTNDRFTLKASGMSKVEVVDVCGRMRAEYRVEGDCITLTTKELGAGVYLVRVTTGEGVASKRLIVR